VNPLLINLARRHFANRRPALRATVALWLLATAGVAANAWLYLRYLQGSGDRGRRLAEIDAGLVAEAHAMEQSRGRLASLDLARQKAVVEFLNGKIDERTFSWSALFDRLARVLPDDVRILRLAPERDQPQSSGRRGRNRAAPAATESEARVVRLQISCESKSDEGLLELVDRLFAHPAFSNVNLRQEARSKDGWLGFELSTDYLPDAAAPVSPAEEPVPSAPGTAEGLK
jgi:hypothetical protein